MPGVVHPKGGLEDGLDKAFKMFKRADCSASDVKYRDKHDGTLRAPGQVVVVVDIIILSWPTTARPMSLDMDSEYS